MSRWQQNLDQLRLQGTAAILVSVDSIIGSTPREPGAKMIVTSDQLYGTIGGGNLEFQACAIARNQIEAGDAGQLRRFPLGAGLGQCCGGLVNLMFAPLQNDADWSKAAQENDIATLYLFGAGHVGQALVRAMQDLPVQIHWIDSRESMFPDDYPENVSLIATDTGEAEIDAAPAGSYFLVMTHDHSLDQSLCEAILKRDDFAYFGLIGSKSKRRNFETRIKRRGISAGRLQRMVCPIGIGEISSKQPAAIAISVAAQILQVYDQQHSMNTGETSANKTLGETA